MINWKNAHEEDLLRLEAIKILFGRETRLLDFLFHPDKPRLSASLDLIKSDMRCFSSGEQVLINIALDIWSSDGGIHFDDLYATLDYRTFRRCMKALRFIKAKLYSGDEDMAGFSDFLEAQVAN